MRYLTIAAVLTALVMICVVAFSGKAPVTRDSKVLDELAALQRENAELKRQLAVYTTPASKLTKQAKEFTPGVWSIVLRDRTSLVRRVNTLDELLRIVRNRRDEPEVSYDDDGTPVYFIKRVGD